MNQTDRRVSQAERRVLADFHKAVGEVEKSIEVALVSAKSQTSGTRWIVLWTLAQHSLSVARVTEELCASLCSTAMTGESFTPEAKRSSTPHSTASLSYTQLNLAEGQD